MQSNQPTLTYSRYITKSFLDHWELPAMTDYPGRTLQYSEVAEEMLRLHVLFENCSLNPGDKIALCGRNCSNWAITFLGITTYGAVAVPLLHEFTPENIHYILKHSESKALFVSKKIWRSLDPKQLDGIKVVVAIDDFTLLYSTKMETEKEFDCWQERAADILFHSFCREKFPDMIYHYGKDELMVLNYTSGTTSNPKGVMIPSRAIASNITFGFEVMPTLSAGDKVVSLLPLAHTYGMSFEFLTEIALGMHIHFLVKPLYQQYLMNAFAEVRPSVIIVVPLILEKIVRKGVFPLIQNPYVKVIRKLPVFKQIINKAVRRKLYNVLGGKFYEIIVGGAALSRDVEEFLKEIHYPFTVGYGMTECSPIIGYSDWKDFKVGSCGKAAPRMEVKIDSSKSSDEMGEILTRGANVMLGYYKNEEETNAVLDADGWLHTGDMGTLDKEGNIYIKGRCKTMLLGSNGQNIYPEEIEDKISSIRFVSEVIVVQRDGKLVALIYPDYQNAVIEDIVGREQLLEYLNKQLKQVNKMLPAYERVASIEIMEDEFEKTPKKSIKRYLYK